MPIRIAAGTFGPVAAALVLATLAMAQPLAAQDRIQVGCGLSSGVIGAEVVWETRRSSVLAAGLGVAGVGGRLAVESRPAPAFGDVDRSMHVGVTYLLTPWRFGQIQARGAAGVEAGIRILHPGQRIYVDLAGGLAAPHHGSWGGGHLLPSLRFQLGASLR
jgi:hypothetical protein